MKIYSKQKYKRSKTIKSIVIISMIFTIGFTTGYITQEIEKVIERGVTND